MRRCSALLSVLLAAGSAFAAPAAHATPICAEAWTGGSVIRQHEFHARCVDYPYGTQCDYHHAYVDPQAHVYAVVCYPRPF